MRWTQAALLTRALILRTVKSCGPDAPTLASSFVKQFARRRWQESPVTGESAKETVKTIAQGRPGETGEPVVTMLVCFFQFAREAAGAAGTRLSLRPLFSEAIRIVHRSGAWRRENAEACPNCDIMRGATATKRSSLRTRGPDHGLLRLRSQ
jgi:hypothetical protein